MNRPAGRARTASQISGYYYQHLVAWNEALNALRPSSGAIGVTVEHPEAGNVDDIVIHRRDGPDSFIQVKHAVDATTPVGHKWLTAKRTKSMTSLSLLQKLHRSWHDLAEQGDRPELRLVTDRDIDPNDPVMSRIDRNTGLLVPGINHSAAVQKRAEWADHLGIAEVELLMFLHSLRIETGRSILAEKERAATLMHATGLNDDQQAIDSAIGLLTDWVLRRERKLTNEQLLEWAYERIGHRTEQGAVVVIDAIDYDPHPGDAVERICFVGDYDGDEPFERRQLRDPSKWPRIQSEIEEAAYRLRSAGVRRVILRGAMRLPTWFAAGAAFRDVTGFGVAGVQRGEIWSSDKIGKAVALSIDTTPLDEEADLAVAIGIAADPTDEIRNYIASTELPITSLTSILPAGGPNPAAIPDGPSAAAVAVAARDAIRRLLATNPAESRIHLFLATPGALALLLGHRWNAMRPTTVYEHLGPGNGYAPTIQIAG